MHIHYHYPRPEPFSPYPPGGQVPDYARWMKEQLALKQDKLTFDILPVESSLNPVTSGGLYLALATKASLVNGKVPAEQLPSYVDDVLEFASRDAFPDPGEGGILYVARDQNLVYRWTGTNYVAVVSRIDIDTTVTRLSSNPVASLGIWAAIWGSLNATPAGYTSLYDWCVSQLAGKLNNTTDTMSGALTVQGSLTVGTRSAGKTVGANSVAEGSTIEASGNCSHAEGISTTASGDYSHAEGGGTKSQNEAEHAHGRFNSSHKASSSFGDAGNTLSSIGFGSAHRDRKNAVETMQDGKTYIYGLGGYDGTNPAANGVLDLVASIYTVVQQIAPAWVSGTAYTANKLCSYNGVVYQNTSGATIQSATTPDTSGSGWTPKKVSELFLPLTGGTLFGDLTYGACVIEAGDCFKAKEGATFIVERGTPPNYQIMAIGLGYFELWRFGQEVTHSFQLNFPNVESGQGTIALTAGTGHEGNLAKLDANGNPIDSGKAPTDFAPATKAVTATATETMLSPDCFPIRYTDGGTTVELSADEVEFTPQFVLRVKGASPVVALATFALPSGGQTISDYSQYPDITFGGRAPTTGVWPAYLREGETYSETYPAVYGNDIAPLAPLASPAFTGTPTAPTPASGDNSGKVATTAFVQAAIAGGGGGGNLDYCLRVDPETGGIYYTTPDNA